MCAQKVQRDISLFVTAGIGLGKRIEGTAFSCSSPDNTLKQKKNALTCPA